MTATAPLGTARAITGLAHLDDGTAVELGRAMTNLDPHTLSSVSGGGFARDFSGSVLGATSGTLGGLTYGTYKAVTVNNNWPTFRDGFATGYRNVGDLGQKIGRAGVDAITGAASAVRENWGK